MGSDNLGVGLCRDVRSFHRWTIFRSAPQSGRDNRSGGGWLVPLGFCGAALVWAFYKDHYDATDDPDTKLGTFCTMPAIYNPARNFFCEFVGTWLLVFCILMFSVSGNTSEVGLGASGSFPVTMLIMAIGMSLGGATGYAINPARDLAPRIAHAVLPFKSPKRDSGWNYSWVPVLGPIAGAAFAALCFILIF